MSTSLLITGAQGLVGSRFVSDFGQSYAFDELDVHHPTSPVDITSFEAVLGAFQKSSAQSVVHLAAYTDVTGAWQQTGDKTGVAYKVNVTGTENIVKAAEATGKHLLHISTAYVFNGEKSESYVESDPVSPIEWYGQTKAMAEEVVMKSSAPWCILRIDQPFRSDSFVKPDAVRKIVNLIRTRPDAKLFNDHYFGPTFIDDFSKVIDWAVRTSASGIYHASAGEKLSDFEFGTLISDTLGLDLQFGAGSLAEYLKTSQRPYQKNTSLNIAKLQAAIDFELKTVKEAVSLVNL